MAVFGGLAFDRFVFRSIHRAFRGYKSVLKRNMYPPDPGERTPGKRPSFYGRASARSACLQLARCDLYRGCFAPWVETNIKGKSLHRSLTFAVDSLSAVVVLKNAHPFHPKHSLRISILIINLSRDPGRFTEFFTTNGR
jgi:hypothetical protein